MKGMNKLLVLLLALTLVTVFAVACGQEEGNVDDGQSTDSEVTEAAGTTGSEDDNGDETKNDTQKPADSGEGSGEESKAESESDTEQEAEEDRYPDGYPGWYPPASN